MTREHRLTLPFSPEQAHELNCGDTVYLSGVIHTMRDMGHRRAVDMLARGERLPFDLRDGAIWHCGPIVRKFVPPNSSAALAQERWEVLSAGPTTSSRFNQLGPELMRSLRVRCTIGKGTMGDQAIQTMRDVGGCFLNATGGCGALYAGQIEEVVNVFWTDLGLPEAVWVLRAKELGPLVVGIDAHGNSLFGKIGAQMRSNLEAVYREAGIRRDYNLAYLPKRVAGKGGGKL
jgi:tartrate/fumarate subfamily iron-sulfur-dependent hydro-lyase beta chain